MTTQGLTVSSMRVIASVNPSMMSQPTPYDELVQRQSADAYYLRQEIRNAGAISRRLRWEVRWAIVAPPLSLAIYLWSEGAFVTMFQFDPGTLLFWFFILAEIGVGAGWAYAAIYRCISRRLLARRLSNLSPGDRVAVLRPLLEDPLQDTRQIAEPLFRGLSVPPREVVAVAAPEARGVELVASNH